MKKAIIAAGIVVAVCYFLLARAPLEDGTQPGVASSYLEGVSIVSRQGGKVEWILNTDRVELNDDATRATMSSVRIEFPERKMQVNARGGTFDIASRNVTLSGGILAEGSGFSIETESVSLDAGNGALTTDGRVEAKGESFRIAGIGLRATRDKIEVLNNVEAEFYR